MHIGICDDEENIRSYIRKLIEKQEEECRITEYASGEELLQNKNEKIDILFLDIAMGDVDGMSVAKKLRQRQEKKKQAAWGSLPLLIFVTGFSEYMSDAFSVNAFQYIVKPIKEQDFEKVFLQAVREYRYITERKSKTEKEITVGSGANAQNIKADDILYIESNNHKVFICLQDTQKEHYGKISDLEKELQPDFFRIHKGYLINLKHIESYNRTDIQMKNGDNLRISKYKYPDFVKAYLQYIAKE